MALAINNNLVIDSEWNAYLQVKTSDIINPLNPPIRENSYSVKVNDKIFLFEAEPTSIEMFFGHLIVTSLAGTKVLNPENAAIRFFFPGDHLCTSQIDKETFAIGGFDGKITCISVADGRFMFKR